MSYALTVYPLSNGFRDRLERQLSSEPAYLNLAEFRGQSLTRNIARLRGLQGARLILALEDENSQLVLPALLAVAAISNAGSIEVCYPDMRSERVSRLSLVRSFGALTRASVAAHWDAAVCHRELNGLLTATPMAPRRDDRRSVMYLNANLWFGVKAGGSIGHVAGVVNALSQGGHDVRYATAGGRTMIGNEVRSLALEPPSVFAFPPELNQYAFHRSTVNRLMALERPGFIYQRMSLANYSGVALSRRWGVPLVLEYNGSEVWIAKHWGRPLRYPVLAKKAEDVCLRHAHVIVTISDVLRDELIERGVSPERVVMYPNCIDPDVFDPGRFPASDGERVRRQLGVPSDTVLATFIGTFGQWHGIDVLARAIRSMVEHDAQWLRRHKLHFMLVGDGLKMPLVREILGDECREFATLTGLVGQHEAPAYLAASDILLSPHVANQDGTRFFGSPTKLFEYMAMGKAIVASDLDQIGQILRNSLSSESLPEENKPADNERRLSILCPPGAIPSIVNAIKFAVERPAWRAALGQNARHESLAKYTWQHHVAAILERLDSVAG